MSATTSFTAMGCQVLVAGAGEADLLAIRALFDAREQAFSRFRPGSELNRVNAAASDIVVVSELFSDTLADALRAAEQTDGLVDPTVGAALEAAGYDRDFARLRPDPLPADPGVPGALRTVRQRGRIVSRPSTVKLDLNGVVKSRAVDDALRLLPGPGFVAAGGDIAARGGTLVGLPHGGTLVLEAGGLATSGTTRRRWRRGGRVEHHLIDPATGRPSASPWTLVTVAAASCRDADVAAKAAFLLGADGPDWLDERGLPGRFCAGAEPVTNATWRTLLGAPATAVAA